MAVAERGAPSAGADGREGAAGAGVVPVVARPGRNDPVDSADGKPTGGEDGAGSERRRSRT